MTVGPKILIVDDDPSFVRAYQAILQEEGYTAESATTRAEALACLDAGDWTVVLIDQRLRGADGPDSGLDLLEEVSASAGVLDYRIALHEVLPPRTAGTPPNDDSYALTLTVDPARVAAAAEKLGP